MLMLLTLDKTLTVNKNKSEMEIIEKQTLACLQETGGTVLFLQTENSQHDKK